MAGWYEENYDDGSRFLIEMTDVLFAQQSEFQFVEVIDTRRFGRVLIIDGVFMTSERDEHFYHEMIAHPALVTAPSIQRVLIIGGGDGGTARQVLRHPEVESVLMIEIDQVVVDACKQHMPGLGAWSDDRLTVRFQDGIAYVKETDDPPFDVVLLDGTDPVGPGKGLFNVEFFRGVRRVLKPGGVFVNQSESPIDMPELFSEIQGALRQVFSRVSPYFGPAPLYNASNWSWTYCTDATDPVAPNPARLEAIEAGCQYYNRDVHGAAFVQSSDVRKALAALDGAGT